MRQLLYVQHGEMSITYKEGKNYLHWNTEENVLIWPHSPHSAHFPSSAANCVAALTHFTAKNNSRKLKTRQQLGKVKRIGRCWQCERRRRTRPASTSVHPRRRRRCGRCIWRRWATTLLYCKQRQPTIRPTMTAEWTATSVQRRTAHLHKWSDNGKICDYISDFCFVHFFLCIRKESAMTTVPVECRPRSLANPLFYERGIWMSISNATSGWCNMRQIISAAYILAATAEK